MSEIGRPTVMTPETIDKLEEAFSYGASDLEACFIAGIGKSTLYNYQNENPDFVERKEGLKNLTKYQARRNVVEKIRNGEYDASTYYLDRKAKDEFSTKQEIDANVKTDIEITDDQLDRIIKERAERANSDGSLEERIS